MPSLSNDVTALNFLDDTNLVQGLQHQNLRLASRPRIAIALEYPLMQQGGTEVLVRELIRGLSGHFELVLVSGERDRFWGIIEFWGMIEID